VKRRFPLLTLLACALVFALGVYWLFQLRFAHGDVYPAYSSLRADPLGTMALYESLARIPGVNVHRDYSVEGRLPEGRAATYLHLAGDAFDWTAMPAEVVDEIESFVTQGGRLVVAFEPELRGWSPTVKTWTVPPAVVPGSTNQPVTVTMTNTPPRLRRTWKEIQREQDEREYVNVEERWAFKMDSEALKVDEDGVAQPVFVVNRSGLKLPLQLPWHSANQLQRQDTTWKIIYARGTNAVLMEKRMGAGTLVLATDCYFTSNEALTLQPHADLLAWLVGSGRTIYFDEAHLGVTEDPGVTTLMWRYGLQGLVAGTLLVLGLFIWKNSTSFIPMRPPPKRAGNEIVGKDASAGFVNLLRRHVKPAELLTVCFDEWTKSLRQRSNYTVSGVDRAQTVMEQEVAKPPRTRNSVQAYNEIAHALQSRHLRHSPTTAPGDSPLSHEPIKS